MQSKVAFAAALAAGLSAVGAASAAPMEFVFTGTVTAIDGSIDQVEDGDPVDGRIIFDSTDVPGDSHFDPSIGLFVSSPSFIEGAVNVQATPTEVRSFIFGPLLAGYILQSSSADELVFSIANSNSSGSRGFNIGIVDATAPFMTLSTINTISPFVYVFEGGDGAEGAVVDGGTGVQFSVAWAELRFVPAPAPAAPEPAALGLLGLGVAGLWRVRRRKSG